MKLNMKLFIMLACSAFITNATMAATVNNKSSSFKVSSGTTSGSSSSSAMAEKIRAQRAALDARDAQGIVATGLKAGATNNDCDGALRKCIEKKCGTNYSKCATDSETIFSDKLTACKKDAGCTAHEFTLFTNQIREDKKQEIALASYNNVIDCDTSYNNCIIDACGPKFAKCLSKSNGDQAINKCKQIATRCTEADSGMAGRMGNIFGIVRQNEEIQIAADEKKLYELRDKMESSCKSLGAMFDERSFDCVFTAYFFAGPEAEPKASKKLYAGSVFDCTPDWFGIDITTFKENAYRATRAQTAASSAMLGSGVGTAVGTITSGAMGRALDRQKAEKELKEECAGTDGMIFDKKKGECRKMNPAEIKEQQEQQAKQQADEETKKAKEACEKRPGTWEWDSDANDGKGDCVCESGKYEDEDAKTTCRKLTKDEKKEAKAEKKEEKKQKGCESGKKRKGTWTSNTCDCPTDYYWSTAAPYHCLPSIKAIGNAIKFAGETVACKTATGVLKTSKGVAVASVNMADGTIRAFTDGENEKFEAEDTAQKIGNNIQSKIDGMKVCKDAEAYKNSTPTEKTKKTKKNNEGTPATEQKPAPSAENGVEISGPVSETSYSFSSGNTDQYAAMGSNANLTVMEAEEGDEVKANITITPELTTDNAGGGGGQDPAKK